MTGVRLQKVLAAAGVGSRRACEQLIAEGRVSVDGRVVTEQGVRVDPSSAVVLVDGERISTAPDLVVLALNKPRGVVSAMSDDRGRPCLADYVSARPERLFHVGRLDIDTEGLILLTNDGALSQRLAHPSHEVGKTYLARVHGTFGKAAARHLESGVELDDGIARVDHLRVVASTPREAILELTLHEGRNRIVRRMLEAVGTPVVELSRISIGPIRLGDLPMGRWRVLGRPEVGALHEAVGL